MDAWFAGYHQTLTAVTWIGYDTPRKLGDRETGGGLSLPVWISYMQHALKNTPVSGMPVPAGVVFEGNDWFYQEYTHSTGVTSLGIEAKPAEGEAVDPEKKKILDDLESVVGIGHSHALEFYNQGVKSVADLKKKIKSGAVEVNEKIQLGLKYYGKFQGNIPRKEITSVYKIIVDIIKQLNKKVPEEKQFIFEICGSYRREKPTSGDIDILISKKSDIDSKENYLENIVKFLKEPLKKNDDKPLLIDDLTDKNIETKYMGFAQYKDNPPRRIDIRYIEWPSYYSALLYFTGSAELNKKMRQIAKTMGYKLSEYGLTSLKDNKMVPIESEYDVFKILKIE
jgi:DNA polymerase/3'-5' exonuclease PolX